MQERKTKFIVEVSHRNVFMPSFVGLGAMLAGIFFAWLLPQPLGTFVCVATIIAGSGFTVVKMLKPDEYVLKIDNGYAQFFKNQQIVAEAATSALEIELKQIHRWRYVSSRRYLLKTIVAFPSGKKIEFTVTDKYAVFIQQMPDDWFDLFSYLEYQGSFAHSRHVQHLLDYFNLNHQVKLENIY